MNTTDECEELEALEHEGRIPNSCPHCKLELFWCHTCAAAAQGWVCGCTHPRQAQDLIGAPLANPNLVVGEVVKWKSPFFGVLSGVYLGSVGPRQVRVRHPLTVEDAVIPTTWLVGVNKGERMNLYRGRKRKRSARDRMPAVRLNAEKTKSAFAKKSSTLAQRFCGGEPDFVCHSF